MRVNWRHPLTNRLRAVCVCNGSIPGIELLSGRPLVLTGTTTDPALVTTLCGQAWLFTTANSLNRLTMANNERFFELSTPQTFSIAARVSFLVTPTAARRVVGIGGSAGFATTATGQLQLRGVGAVATCQTIVQPNALYMVVVSGGGSRNGQAFLYLNGGLDGFVVDSAPGASVAGVEIGAGIGANTECGAAISSVFVWKDRMLSQAEAVWLTQSPFDFFL